MKYSGTIPRMHNGFPVTKHVLTGEIVRVKLSKDYHEGVVLGEDILGGVLVGVLKTTLKGVVLKPGKKFISVFHGKESQLEVIA